jgi:hypothetical protein
MHTKDDAPARPSRANPALRRAVASVGREAFCGRQGPLLAGLNYFLLFKREPVRGYVFLVAKFEQGVKPPKAA